MTTEELNKRIAMFYRAEQISREYRKKFGMGEKESAFADSSMPEFQEEIDTTHCFNRYIKALRERYTIIQEE